MTRALICRSLFQIARQNSRRHSFTLRRFGRVRCLHLLLHHEKIKQVRILESLPSSRLTSSHRVTTYIHLSVLLAFLAAIFDLSQIVRRGYWDTMYDLNISSVQVLMILRELGHALSFGFRYLSFWFFVAEPPRGELPFVPMQDDRRPNFISLSSEEVIHSGDWTRLKLMGIILKWTLLLLTLSVTVLQILWRLVDAFRIFGPIYVTEAGIEIGLSVAFISKLAFNSFISPLTPRWHTLRDYSAVISAISIGMGVAIGNLLCCEYCYDI